MREVLRGHHHLRRLQSDTVALQLLRVAHPDAAIGDLYSNAAKVSTNARQAILYEQSAAGVDFAIRPLILYYSYLHWMKTLLYASDLAYPRGSSLLQHGMSVRKVKRAVYRWPLDYAYIYKEGVLQSFRDIVAPDLVLPNKIPVGHLLGSIPSVCEAAAQFYPEFQHMYALNHAPPAKMTRSADALAHVSAENAAVSVGAVMDARAATSVDQLARENKPVSAAWYVSRRIASNIGLTPAEWLDACAAACDGSAVRTALHGFRVHGANHEEESKSPDIDRDYTGFLHLPTLDETHPWLHTANQVLWIGDGQAYPLWISHLITVYVLSTLCRYNAVEWLDIVHWNNDKDAHLVREYLEGVPTFPELMGSVR